jgi:alpha-galactosidase/6-phospho-beta-glucosidase family protein
MKPVRPLPARVFREEISPKIDEMERGLEAFLSGDRRLVLIDILADRRTKSRDQAEAVLKALLEMPGHEEAAVHFR